jgi:hypothetical protein
MYANGQTLVHKKTRKLARIAPELGGSQWAWSISKNTSLVAKDGTWFVGDIKDYECIKDELGRPYYKPPAEGQFVDESAERYLVSKSKLAKMKKKRLEEWEAEILDRMAHGGPGPTVKTIEGLKTTSYPKTAFDTAGKRVHCPFTDGNRSTVFHDYFMKRRKAVPLYREWNYFRKEYQPGPMVFRHSDGQLWMYNRSTSELVTIEPGSINIPWGGL